MDDPLGLGKPPPELLFAALGSGVADSVLQGPGPGRDAGVVEWQGQALVAAADPITFADRNAGRLAVQVNANDIYAVGAEPRWMLATVLAPPGAGGSELRELLLDLSGACREASIELIGGHTEVTDAVQRTVISCAMLGSARLEQIVPSDGAQVGDLVLQAGAGAIEGTALLATELSNELLARGLPPDWLDAAAALAADPGISIRTAALALRAVDGVHAMHDVTEGGIATAARELAQAAGLGVTLDANTVLWRPETNAVAAALGLERLGLLGSGTLLAAVDRLAAEAALRALRGTAVDAAVIGEITGAGSASLVQNGSASPLPDWTQDEALRALAAARTESAAH